MAYTGRTKVKTYPLSVPKAGAREVMSIDLTTDVTGVLPAANGGIGTAGANSATAAYPKTTAGVQTLLAAASFARQVIIHVRVSEVFANGTGAQPTFKIGVTAADDTFAATTEFTNAALGTVKSYAGTLDADKALIVTGTAATGTATGALAVTVLAL